MSCHHRQHLTAINNYVGRIGQELLLLRLRTNNHLWHGIAPFRLFYCLSLVLLACFSNKRVLDEGIGLALGKALLFAIGFQVGSLCLFQQLVDVLCGMIYHHFISPIAFVNSSPNILAVLRGLLLATSSVKHSEKNSALSYAA